MSLPSGLGNLGLRSADEDHRSRVVRPAGALLFVRLAPIALLPSLALFAGAFFPSKLVGPFAGFAALLLVDVGNRVAGHIHWQVREGSENAASVYATGRAGENGGQSKLP